jgi:hypothetical protein
MSDDLVFRLKQMEEFFHLDYHRIKKISREAAYRIEKLGRANDDLANEFIAAASLLRRGDIRIEKLEAALGKIIDTDPDEGTSWFHDIARKALEGKDDVD